MPRLFFGLEIAPEIKRRLLRVRTTVPGAKWQTAGQLHLTLIFLGNVDEDRLPELCNAASRLPIDPFDLQITGLGCFGPPQKPKNLWADVGQAEAVAELQNALQQQIERLGFAPGKRRFRPHITLARFKGEAGSVEALLDLHGEETFGQYAVSEFVLFSSEPGENGSVYTVTDRFPLGAQGSGSLR